MDSLNLHTHTFEDQLSADEYENPRSLLCNDSKQQFSFSRHLLRSRNDREEICQHEHRLKQKYHEIYTDLKGMENQQLVELLLEELDDNEKYKIQLTQSQLQKSSLLEQSKNLKEALKKKRQTISILCETESKNLQIIEKLDIKLSKRNDRVRDTHYEKKYQELSLYMSEYIRNVNTAHEEFQNSYGMLKNQNSSLEKQLSLNNTECLRMFKKSQYLAQQVRSLKKDNYSKQQALQRAERAASIMNEENQILRRQIEVYQENLRITDRLQVHLEQQNQQLSSDLDFLRQRICENQNVSRDIIERLEQSSSHYGRANKAKEQLYQSLNKQKEKTKELQKQIEMLRKKNENLQAELNHLKGEYNEILKINEEMEMELTDESVQKQAIKKELLLLADKVKIMEATYRNQLQQNQKIKDQLSRFWENKEKRQSHCLSSISHENVLVLGEMRRCSNSESTFTPSVMESKSKLKPNMSDSLSFTEQKENNQPRDSNFIC